MLEIIYRHDDCSENNFPIQHCILNGIKVGYIEENHFSGNAYACLFNTEKDIEIHCNTIEEAKVWLNAKINIWVAILTEKKELTRKIVQAAILDHDGQVYVGHRHNDVINVMAFHCKLPTPISGEQGFVDNKGNFLTRKEAGRIALENGQIAKLSHPDGELYSEDLY